MTEDNSTIIFKFNIVAAVDSLTTVITIIYSLFTTELRGSFSVQSLLKSHLKINFLDNYNILLKVI